MKNPQIFPNLNKSQKVVVSSSSGQFKRAVTSLKQANDQNEQFENMGKTNNLNSNFQKSNYEQPFKVKQQSQIFTNTRNVNIQVNQSQQLQQQPETIIKQIDNKLELHKKDIDVRNDMIINIEKAIQDLRKELIREKIVGEEKTKQVYELSIQIQAMQLKFKNSTTKGEELLKQMNNFDRDQKKMKDNHLKEITMMKQNENTMKQNENTMSQQIIQLQQQLEISNKKIVEVKDDSKEKEMQQTISKLEKYNIIVENELKTLKQMNLELNGKLESEQKEKQLLKKQLDDKIKDSTNQQEKLNLQISNLNKKIIENSNEDLKNKDLWSSLKKAKDDIESLTKQLDVIQILKDELAQKDARKEKEQKEIIQLKEQIQSLNMKSQIFQENLAQLSKTLEEKSDFIHKLQNEQMQVLKTNSQLQAENLRLQKALDDKETKLKQTKPEKPAWITQTISQLEQSEKEIMKNLTCMFCKQFIKQPVTIIPCGHSYCFDCKKGYSKECSSCGPKVKVEAMYRNELLDDIIAMVKLIQNSVALMKQQK